MDFEPISIFHRVNLIILFVTQQASEADDGEGMVRGLPHGIDRALPLFGGYRRFAGIGDASAIGITSGGWWELIRHFAVLALQEDTPMARRLDEEKTAWAASRISTAALAGCLYQVNETRVNLFAHEHDDPVEDAYWRRAQRLQIEEFLDNQPEFAEHWRAGEHEQHPLWRLRTPHYPDLADAAQPFSSLLERIFADDPVFLWLDFDTTLPIEANHATRKVLQRWLDGSEAPQPEFGGGKDPAFALLAPDEVTNDGAAVRLLTALSALEALGPNTTLAEAEWGKLPVDVRKVLLAAILRAYLNQYSNWLEFGWDAIAVAPPEGE